MNLIKIGVFKGQIGQHFGSQGQNFGYYDQISQNLGVKCQNLLRISVSKVKILVIRSKKGKIW